MRIRAVIRTARDALAGSPHLLADYVLDRVEDIDPATLGELGFRHVVFDYDNTLARWRVGGLAAPVRAVIQGLLDAGITVAIASNGLGGRFRKLAAEWRGQVPCLGSCGKPDSGKIARLMEDMGWDPHATLMVGDNILTDIAAGRAAGCATALVRPISWFEAPTTKAWRVLEVAHRLRRPEWQTVTRLGSAPSRPRRAGGAWLAAVLGAAVLFLAPLIRPAAPGSEVTSYQLGMARAFGDGWPAVHPAEPERSLLTMALLSVLPDPLAPPPAPGVVSLALLLAGVAGCSWPARAGSGFGVAAITLPIVVAPAVIAAAGEVSPAVVELALAGAALVAPVTASFAGIVFFLSLLNGLSAVAVVPVLLLRAPRSRRAMVAAAIALAGLLAAACWIGAMSRPATPSPGWDFAWADEAGIAVPGMVSGATLRQRLDSLEQGIRHALLGRAEGGAKIPLASLAVLLSLPALAGRAAGAAVFLVLRTGMLLLAPGLFARELLVVVPLCVVAMSTVFHARLGGRGPAVFALILAMGILPYAPMARRQVASVRQAYRSNSELMALARSIQALPQGTCIATPNPAMVYLGSGHCTVPPDHGSNESPTHAIAPRRDPLADDCIATRSLMLCPRECFPLR